MSRQPIFRWNLDIYGYELFFGNLLDGPPESDHEPRALIEFARRALPDLVGTAQAFINVTRSTILSGLCDGLPAKGVVLEVLEDVPSDPDVIRELERLSRAGYRIALDDFSYSAARAPLVDLADIVKIDVLEIKGAKLEELVRRLRSSDAGLLAEKVETEDTLEVARDLGFEYFQGYHLGRPATRW